MKQKKQCKIYLQQETHNKLIELAGYNDLNNSNMIEYLIKRACKGRKLSIV